MGKSMKRMKQVISVFLSLILSLAFSFVSLADVATSSNAVVMNYNTLPADDGIMPFSSLGTVENTVKPEGVSLVVYYNTDLDAARNTVITPTYRDGRFHFSYTLPGGCYATSLSFLLHSSSLPPAGDYLVSFDSSSDITYDIAALYLYSRKDTTNATNAFSRHLLSSSQYNFFAGDLYVQPVNVSLNNLAYFWFLENIKGTSLHDVSGSFAFHFESTSPSSSSIDTAGTNTSSQDTQNEISSNTSQIADSVGNMSSSLSDMSSSLENAAESLDYISQSQNLIIKGIDNIILHISDQLYAFWDQLYNLIHVPTMAKLQEILEAIKNMNLNVDVDLDELKSAISRLQTSVVNQIASSTNTQINNDNKLSQEQMNNDNQNTDTLANGYDNASMNADKDKLDAALSEYESAENQLFDDAKGHIKGFDFKDGLNEIVGPLTDISYFLSGIFTGIGSMNIAVSFSLTLSVALVLIGWYRFKGGG